MEHGNQESRNQARITASTLVEAPSPQKIPRRTRMKITSIVPLVVNVSEKTNWFFVRVETDAGLSGLGEATLSGGWESVQHTCLQRLGVKLVGKEVEQVLPGLQVYPHSPGGLAWNSVLSAVEQALIDICARHAGVPIQSTLRRSSQRGRAARPAYPALRAGPAAS